MSMSCEVCGFSQLSGARCSTCGWKFNGPLERVLSQVREAEQGCDAEQCLAAIQDDLQSAGQDPEFTRLITVLIRAGNPQAATELILKAGRSGKSDWGSLLKPVLVAGVSFGILCAIHASREAPAIGGHLIGLPLGALFLGLAASGPSGITFGTTSGTNLTPDTWTSSRSATRGEGNAWVVMMLLAGIALSAFGLFGDAVL